jgi:hypothetical protein
MTGVGALASLGEDQVLESIWLVPMARSTEEQVQKELFEYFEEHYPEELKAASSSSGNLHNPKLGPVMAGYREAVRSTSYVAELAEILAKHDYRIAGVGFELSATIAAEGRIMLPERKAG